MILAFLSLVCGLVLEIVTLGRREMKRLHYLREPPPSRTSPAEAPRTAR